MFLLLFSVHSDPFSLLNSHPREHRTFGRRYRAAVCTWQSFPSHKAHISSRAGTGFSQKEDAIDAVPSTFGDCRPQERSSRRIDFNSLGWREGEGRELYRANVFWDLCLVVIARLSWGRGNEE